MGLFSKLLQLLVGVVVACALVVTAVILLVIATTPPDPTPERQAECEARGGIYHTNGRHAGVCFPDEEAERRAYE